MKEIFIVGPTGAGKSDYATRLYDFIVSSNSSSKVALVNVDTISFYKYFDISSAKPSYSDRNRYNYFGLDIASASRPINVYDFYCYYDQLKENGYYTHFILVGGSGLYIDSLYYNYSFSMNITSSKESNSSLKPRIDLNHANNSSRHPHTSSNPRHHQVSASGQWHFNIDRITEVNKPIIGLSHSQIRDEQFIINRFKQMLNLGAIDETRELIARYGADNPILHSVNYSSLVTYIMDHKSIEWLFSDIVMGNKKLVKKQRTWFNRNSNVRWVDGANIREDESLWADII